MTTTMTAATTPAPAYGPATDIAAGENANPDAAGPHAPYATHPNTMKETIPMTDQTIPADKVRPILDEWERIKQHADWVDMDNLVQEVRALLPAPPRPTLADMTEEERAACQWMQADLEGYDGRVVIANPCWWDCYARVMWPHTRTREVTWKNVTPRPDLPRLEWPGDTPAPAPALPEGWRIADHKDYGLVVVTNTAPDSLGRVPFVAPTPGTIGNDCHLCDLDELTYIDQEADQ